MSIRQIIEDGEKQNLEVAWTRALRPMINALEDVRFPPNKERDMKPGANRLADKMMDAIRDLEIIANDLYVAIEEGRAFNKPKR